MLAELKRTFLPVTMTPMAPPHLPGVNAAESSLITRLSPTAKYEKRSIQLASGHTINTLSAGAPSLPPLVLVHGWGAGVAFFGRNLCGLARHFRVHLVDWLGFGASSRPPFSTAFSPEEAEGFFLDALDEWVAAMEPLEQAPVAPFFLVGHSLGAFLSVAYAERRPQNVRALVLASPVGVPHAPRAPRSPPTLAVRAVRAVLFVLWDLGCTPQLVMRMVPAAVGRAFARRIITSRLPAGCEETQNALIEYWYQLSVAPGSGEFSLSTILQSGAYARRPLWDRLPDVKQDVTFLYGDRDWMDWRAASELRKQMKGKTELAVLEGAGHHLYYDRPEEFLEHIVKACSEVTDVIS